MENKVFYAVNKMISVQKLHKQLVDSNVANIGIQRTGHRMLMHLSRKGNLPSQKELAEHLDITPAAATVALQRLENDGYISRKIGNDNRYNEITITERGREIVEQSKLLFTQIDDALFTGFSESEIDAFTLFLERIKQNAENKLKERISI